MMRLSYVIISYNRRERLMQTLELLPRVTPLPQDQWEIVVVDNASTDGTVDQIEQNFPDIKLIPNPVNEGMYARNHAFKHCEGQYIISIDDDSYPENGRGVLAALDHMDSHPYVGALVGKVVLPNESCEAPALPGILMGGATCLRKMVLDHVGGFRKEFFRQAEEYDLSFRMWKAGFTVERREDFVFRHDKVQADDGSAPAGRNEELVRQMDLRNNMIIAQRFLPDTLRQIYWDDWKLRYSALARYSGHKKAIAKALLSAWWWRAKESIRGREPLDAEAVENIFGLRRQANLVGEWARRNSVWRVVIADFGKNIWATYNACRSNGLQLRCIADENPAFEDLIYRDLPIAPAHRAFEGGGIDGVVLSNINPAQAEKRAKHLAKIFRGPVLRMWEPSRVATQARANAA